VVGNPGVVREGIQMLGSGGRYLAIGNISIGWTTEIDPAELVMGNKSWISSAFWDGENLKQALDFLRRTGNRFPFHRVLSHKFPLEEINEAFALAAENKVNRAALLP
jgi:Zn-dependent alcohol dehydrogenase